MDREYCQWCQRAVNLQTHHITFKGMGGRHGKAKEVSEAPANKVSLCTVCHGAAHGLRVIDNGFSCRACWRDCAHARR